MRTPIVVSVLVGLLWASEATPAEEGFDPEARAKAIAPFIDEATVAVVHADLSRVDRAPFLPVAVELIPGFLLGTPQEKAEAVAAIDSALWALVQAGRREVYVVVSLSDFAFPLSLVVPLAEGSDDAAWSEAWGSRWLAGERIRGAFVAANRPVRKRLREGPPDPRPELARAFEAAGDTQAQLLVLPPKHTARVLKETLPVLPDEFGGGSTDVFTRGLAWAAIGVDLTPEPTLSVVVQSQDEGAAAEFREKWLQISRAAGKDDTLRAILPDYDQLAPLLVPTVEGDRLTLKLDQENGGSTAVSKALESVFSWARTAAEKSQ